MPYASVAYSVANCSLMDISAAYGELKGGLVLAAVYKQLMGKI